MEKINTETLVSSLFLAGFDRVDSLLFTYTLGKISKNFPDEKFIFKDDEESTKFRKYIDYKDGIYQFKDGYDLNTNVSTNCNRIYLLRAILCTSSIVTSYLSKLDFSDIVSKKAETIGLEKISDYDYLFSLKEKEILSNMQSSKILIRKKS